MPADTWWYLKPLLSECDVIKIYRDASSFEESNYPRAHAFLVNIQFVLFKICDGKGENSGKGEKKCIFFFFPFHRYLFKSK